MSPSASIGGDLPVDPDQEAERLTAARTTMVLLAAFSLLAVLALVLGRGFSSEAARAPRLTAIAVLLLAVTGLTKQMITARRSAEPFTHGFIGAAGVVGPISRTAALVVVYVLALTPLGFIAASILFLAVTSAVLRSDPSALSDGIFGLGAALAIWAVFVQLLGVRLPESVLF